MWPNRDGIERIEHGIKRLDLRLTAATARLALPALGILLMDMSRVEQHKARQIPRRARRDDLASEAALHEER